MRIRDFKNPQQARWRAYQDGLKLHNVPRRRSRTKRVLFFLLLLSVLTFGVLEAIERLPLNLNAFLLQEERDHSGNRVVAPPQLSRGELHGLLGHQKFLNLTSSSFSLTRDGGTFRVQTTLDESLQEHLLRNLNSAHARYISIVALEPFSGRIVGMVSFDKLDPSRNTCLEDLYPAASIFKIVTAAAAVEAHGLGPESELYFNGGKYTLYRSQLTDQRNRHSNQTSLAESFAESINPVFGKIGIHQLGRDGLADFAEAFGFRRPIPFDLPLPISDLVIEEEPFQWAEVASGFNRTTLISPLHGSLIAAAIVNGGVMVEPTIVEEILDAAGNLIYRAQPPGAHSVISPHTSQALKPMMAATVASGTARNLFRGYRTDKILSQVDLGGKTGSISNTERSARFDWFVGYALDPDRRAGLVVSVVVAHEEYIGVRAAQYARMAMTRYFSDYFAQITLAERNQQKDSHLQ